MRNVINLKLLALVALIAVSVVGTASAQSTNANVWVIHGIPGVDAGAPGPLPVDISVNGKGLLAGVEFRGVAGPLSLEPGTYAIDIAPANKTNPYSEKAIISAKVPIGKLESVVIIAHLDAAGNPTASKFVTDFSPPGPYFNRINLFHTAAAPAVDINLKRLDFILPQMANLQKVTNGASASVLALAGWWELGVNPAGMKTPVLGPLQAPVFPGYIYNIFVVGSLKNNSLTILFLPLLPIR